MIKVSKYLFFCIVGAAVLFTVAMFCLGGKEVKAIQYYGVDMANSGEFSELAGYDTNMVMVALPPSVGTWQSYLAEAERTGLKVIIWPLGGCQGSASVPWCWTGPIGGRWDNPDSWDLSGGRAALEFAEQYVAGGGENLLAIASTHEPFWSAGLDHPAEQMRGLYAAMKRVAPNVGVFAHVNAIASFGDQITDGQFDWGGIWLHCFGGAEGTCPQAKQRIRNDYDYVRSNNLNIKLLFSVQTFAISGTAYQMPNYNELYNFTCDLITGDGGILTGEELDAVLYYSWRNPAGYTDILQRHYHPPQNPPGGLFGVIENVYNDCIQGFPPVTPPPSPLTPTSSPPPSTPTSPPSTTITPPPSTSTPPPSYKNPDINRDGIVDGDDMERLLSRWGSISPSAAEDLDSNGKVNSIDASLVYDNWTTSSPPTATPGQPPPTTGDWEGMYGLEYVDPSDFGNLASRGVNLALVNFAGYPQSSWASVYNQAITHGIKIIPMYWQTNWGFGEGAWPFFDYVYGNTNYRNQTFAFYGLHEPCNGSTPYSSHSARVGLYSEFRSRYPGMKVYSEDTNQCGDFGANEADYDHVTLYNFAYAGGSPVWNDGWGRVIYDYNEAKQSAKDRLQFFKDRYDSVGAHTKTIALVQTFAFDDPGRTIWNRMPEASEMYDWGAEVVNENKDIVAAMMWYPWRFGSLYQRNLHDNRYDTSGVDRWLQIDRVADILLAGGPVATSTPPQTTPTSPPIPTSPPPLTPPPGGRPEIYGVRYNIGDSSFQELASLGVMHPNTLIFNVSEVDTVISTAQAVRRSYPEFNPSIALWSGGFPFTCEGITPAGYSLIDHLNQDGGWRWDEILAINGLHEPLGSYACDSISQIQSVVREIKQRSNGRAKLFEKLYSDTSYGQGASMTFADGICDYCAVLYHKYKYGSFHKQELLTDLERDIQRVKSVPPGETMNKFTPWFVTISFPGYMGLYMPSPEEMLDGGSTVMNFTSTQGYQVDGLVWYTWDNINQWVGLDLYNTDGQRAGRMSVIDSLSPF